MNEQYWISLAEEMLGKLGRVTAFTKHAPSIGRYHEEVIKTIIKNFLPDRYSIKTGFVWAGKDLVSGQCDLIIVDENEPNSYYFKDGDFVVVHPDAVVCVIEIKTTLRKKDFKEIVKQSIKLRKLSQTRRSDRTSGCRSMVFAYDSVISDPTKLSHWYEEIVLPDDIEHTMSIYPVDMVCLKHWYMTVTAEDNHWLWGHHLLVKKNETEAWRLAMFLMTLKRYIEMDDNIENNPYELVNFDQVGMVKHAFRYEAGIIVSPPNKTK